MNVSEKQLILQKINACIHNTGAEVIRHIGSHEAVYDIERIRQALGDKQLTAVAYSYGTQIAALYAERFPSSIRSIVFDGVVDIDDLNDNFHGNSGRPTVIRKRLIVLLHGVPDKKLSTFFRQESGNTSVPSAFIKIT